MPQNPFSMYGRWARPSPNGTGKVFFVCPSSSALLADYQQLWQPDEGSYVRVFENDFATPISFCAAGRGDTIYVLPGTYTITTAIAMSVADVHLVALGGPGDVILTGSATNAIDITATGCEVAGLQFNIASTKQAITLVAASGANIHDNVFLSAVGGAASHFILMKTTASNYCSIANNRFISNLVVAGGAITQTSHITNLGSGNVIEHNEFVAGRVTTANAGAVTDGVLFNTAADAGNLVRWNSFTEFNGATFTAGVEAGASAVSGAAMFYDNNFLLATAANAIVNTTGSAGFSNNVANGTV